MPRQNVRAKARGLGAELADLRDKAGLTLRDVADRLGWSAPTVCRIENGARDTTTEEVAALLVVYGVIGKRRDRLLQLARAIDQPGWWESTALGGQLSALCEFEAGASKITGVGIILIPGLLQTPEYIRAVMETGGVPREAIDDRIAIRLGRQKILSRRKPPAIEMIIDESALRRAMGGPAMMAEQLRHIVREAAKPHVTVRVLRNPRHPAIAGPYVLLEFPPPSQPFVHLEHFKSSMFLDEPEDVGEYCGLTAMLNAMALDPGSSREFMAHLAQRYEAEGRKDGRMA